MDKQDVLMVRTLGDFSMTWNGKPIGAGVKAKDSQFTRLMEILIHSRDEGVERGRLEELVFEESNSDDLHHMFRSVIYNTKKKLASEGLPKSDYIVYENGSYFWTKDIPVIEDATVFEEMCRAADEETDPALKEKLYKEAILYYGGDFLPNQTSLVWVIREGRRYRDMFNDCMEKAVALMRESRDFRSMEEIGRHASMINPLAECEFVTMEALISMEHYEDARILYERTVDHYMKELGARPSSDMINMLDRLGGRLDYRFSLMDEVQARLTEGGESGSGGFFCTYPVFQGIYRFMERVMDRSGQSAFLMLCTILDGSGRPMKEGAVLTRLAERLEESIASSIRRSDVACRYGRGQFLILLLNTTIENCEIVEKRINKAFSSEGQRTRVSYHVNVVTYEPPDVR